MRSAHIHPSASTYLLTLTSDSAGSALLAIPKSIGKGYLYVVSGESFTVEAITWLDSR